MAADTVWKPARALKLTHETEPVRCKSLEVAENIGEFDTSNTEGDGYEEFGVDLRSTQVRFTSPQEEGVASLAIGALVDIAFEDGDDAYEGSGRILTKTRKGGGRGGYDIDYTAKFSGALTVPEAS
jgi:hypothetical protein